MAGVASRVHSWCIDRDSRGADIQVQIVGVQYGDDGVQARWLAPTPFFLELGAESVHVHTQIAGAKPFAVLLFLLEALPAELRDLRNPFARHHDFNWLR